MFYYKIQDKDTGSHYIGSCIDLQRRLNQHKNGKQVSCSSIINNNNYEIIILECSDDYERLDREQFWIDKHPECINERDAVRKISKKEYNREWTKRKNRWIRSFGDPRRHNCLAIIDPLLFS
jgi:hypothetical protein